MAIPLKAIKLHQVTHAGDSPSLQTWGPLLAAYSSGQAQANTLALYRVPASATSASNTVIEARRDVPELLNARLSKGPRPEHVIVLGADNDPYPTDELGHRLTRRTLETCLAYQVPVAVITRSPIIERDIDLLQRLAEGPGCSVAIGITIFDTERARAFEPNSASPLRRLETIERLARSNIPTVLSVAPAIWGISDTDLVRLLSAAGEARAQAVYYRRLQLEGEAVERLVSYVQAVIPSRARRVAAGFKWSMSHDAAEDSMRQIIQYTAGGLGLEFLSDAPWIDGRATAPVSILEQDPAKRGEQLTLFGSEDAEDFTPAPPLPPV